MNLGGKGMNDNGFRHQSWEWEYVMLKTWLPKFGYFKYLMKTDLKHNRNLEKPDTRSKK